MLSFVFQHSLDIPQFCNCLQNIFTSVIIAFRCSSNFLSFYSFSQFCHFSVSTTNFSQLFLFSNGLISLCCEKHSSPGIIAFTSLNSLSLSPLFSPLHINHRRFTTRLESDQLILVFLEELAANHHIKAVHKLQESFFIILDFLSLHQCTPS